MRNPRIKATVKDPYSGRTEEVFRAAATLYRGAKIDGELDLDHPASKINPAVGNSRAEYKVAEARAAELTISARVLARTALDLDRLHDAAGLAKVVPAIELAGRALTEPFEVARMARSGLVGDIRTLDMDSQISDLRSDLRR